MVNSIAIAAQNATMGYQDTGTECVKCRFCGKQGLLVLPLRCGTLPKAAGAPPVPAKVAKHATALALHESSYTLRITRVGYLYVLVVRKGTLAWQCYASTPQGYLAQFAADSPPREAPEFSCEPTSCGMNASMVAIPEAEDVSAAYFLFTPCPLTTATLGRLKSIAKAEELCGKGQMTKIHPAAWIQGSHAQPDCLAPGAVMDVLAEFAIIKADHPLSAPITRHLFNATFPAMGTGEASVSMESVFVLAMPHLWRLQKMIGYMYEQKAVALAIYDPIGLAHELNDFRNDALNATEDYLDHADKPPVTNRWKFETLQALKELQKGFETGLVRDTYNEEIANELHILATYEPQFPDDPEELVKHKVFPGHMADYYPRGRDEWERTHPQQVAQRDAALDRNVAERPARLAKAKAMAARVWTNHYEKSLDTIAMGAFEQQFRDATAAAVAEAEKRVDDHLAWLLDDQLVHAFDLFDRNHYPSGFLFEAQSAVCTFGMTGIGKSAAQIDTWLKGSVTDRKNIYLRGLVLNQDDIEQEAAKALKDAADVAASAPAVSAISGTMMRKVLKGFIDVMRKADSAWDEYVREGAKAGNERSLGLETTREGRALFKLSELNRTIFQKGVTNLEQRAVGFFGGYLFARLGDLAEKLRFDELMYGFDPEKPHLDPKTKKPYPPGEEPSRTRPLSTDPEEARLAGRRAARLTTAGRLKMLKDAQARDAERRSGITRTAQEYIASKGSLTSNYHQARIGCILGVMESIALAGKLSDLYKRGEGTSLEYWELAASTLSVVGIGCDVAYGLMKSTREALGPEFKATRGAADIVRGGFKAYAGLCSTAASIIGLFLDFAKLREELKGDNRTSEETIIFAHIFVGGANTIVGAVSAYSYAGALCRRVIVDLAEDAIKRRAALALIARSAEWLATRVFLLRMAAWVTGAGLVLTAGEVAYDLYIFMLPSALDIWITRCVFRNKSLNGNPYSNASAELDALAKARQLM